MALQKTIPNICNIVTNLSVDILTYHWDVAAHSSGMNFLHLTAVLFFLLDLVLTIVTVKSLQVAAQGHRTSSHILVYIYCIHTVHHYTNFWLNIFHTSRKFMASKLCKIKLESVLLRSISFILT